jgi:type I restriction enzyme M protein
VSTAVAEESIDLAVVHERLREVELQIMHAKKRHNGFLRELGLPELL